MALTLCKLFYLNHLPTSAGGLTYDFFRFLSLPLSWEEDVSPLLDEQQLLSVDKIERLLVMLEERREHFQESLLECMPEDRPFFEKRAEEFRAFLNRAVEVGEPIRCSL